jgi:hypothetical protein
MIDYAFSHLLVWSGQMGVRAYQVIMRESPERFAGDCMEDEEAPRVLNASGCSSIDGLYVDGTVFESYSAVAEGTTETADGRLVLIHRTGESVISQADADRMAACAVAITENQFYGSDITDGAYGEDGDTAIVGGVL